jgi:ferredoxin-NADP reductase
LPEFTARAHVALCTPKGLIRKFSLSSRAPPLPDRDQSESNGRGGSASFVDGAKEGDEVLTSLLVNDFALPPRCQAFLFIAGGIAITPIMSIILSAGERGQIVSALLLHSLAGSDGVSR